MRRKRTVESRTSGPRTACRQGNMHGERGRGRSADDAVSPAPSFLASLRILLFTGELEFFLMAVVVQTLMIGSRRRCSG